MQKFDIKNLPLFTLIGFVASFILFYLLNGFSVWLFLILLLWIMFYIIIIRKQLIRIDLAINYTWLILAIIIVISCSLTLFVKFNPMTDTSAVGSNSSSSGIKLTKEQCKPLFDKYDSKMLKIVGPNLKGSIGLKVDPDDCKYTAQYIFMMDANLPANPHADLPYPYNYIGAVHHTNQNDRGHYGVGTVSAARINKGALPDPFATSQEIAAFYNVQNSSDISTTGSFYSSFSRSRYLSESAFNEIFDDSVYEVMDGLPYMKKEAVASGGFSYSIDHEMTEKEGRIVRSFQFTISE